MTLAVSDYALLHPHLHWRAAVGAELHQLRTGATHALVAARGGEVRLRVSHTHNASGLAANRGFRNGISAGDISSIGKH